VNLRALRWLDSLPLAYAGWLLFGLFAAWWGRNAYPFDLEWMEGGMLAHGWRLQRGLPLYAEPTADWIPYVYPPGYSALLASSGDALGFQVGRSLSAVGALAAAAAMVQLVRRHGRSLSLGLLSAAVFLMSYRASGAFLDLVRPDAVAIGLAAWSFTLTTDGRRRTEIAGGLLLCAAYLVKHNLAAFGLPLALGLWAWRGWRPALSFTAASAGPALLMTALLQWRSGGGFLTYLLAVPSSHPMMWDRGMPGSVGETGHWLGVVTAVAGVGLALTARERDSAVHPAASAIGAMLGGAAAAAWALAQPPVVGAANPPAPLLAITFFSVGAAAGAAIIAAVTAVVERRVHGRWWLAFGGMAVGVTLSWLMRAHNGGFINVLIPWHWVLCTLAGVWLGRWRVARPGALAQLGGASLLGLQLVWLDALTEHDNIVPNAQDLEAGHEMTRLLRAHCADGPIFSPYAAWLPVGAGQAPSTHLIAIWDVDHKKGPLYTPLKSLERAMDEHHFVCVVEGGKKPVGYGVQRNYQTLRSVRAGARALIPKTGWRVQPQTILVPKATAP